VIKIITKDLFFRRMAGLRGDLPDYYSYELNQEIRFKIISTIMEHHYERPETTLSQFTTAGSYDEFNEVIKILAIQLGRPLSQKINPNDIIADFLFNCNDEEFLSAIEVLISEKMREKYRRGNDEYGTSYDLDNILKSLINAINEIFKVDKIGYEIVPANLDQLPYIIIPFNSKYLHLETIRKPMSLMYDEDFEGPLNEFEDALDEYRNEEYKDSIHKANKSYESTLKTILGLRNVEYSSTDTIPRLVEKIRNESDLIDSSMQTMFDSFWSVLKNGPPNIRNLEGIGHGQGPSIREVEKSFADFVLRLAGSYIVFLIERHKETR